MPAYFDDKKKKWILKRELEIFKMGLWKHVLELFLNI